MTDRIVSHPASQEYRDNYDRVFGKKIGRNEATVQEIVNALRGGKPIDSAPSESGGYAFIPYPSIQQRPSLKECLELCTPSQG